jgi:membrane protein
VSAVHHPSSHAGREPGPAAKPEPGASRHKIGAAAEFEAEEPGRGRTAESPWNIPWRGWRDIVWRTSREIGQDRLTVAAASVTYYTLLAIFPALGVFVALYGLFADVGEVQKQLAQLAAVFPPRVLDLIGDQMLRLAQARTGGLTMGFLVSLLLSIWSANAGMKSLFDGLNVAYDETERRSWVRRTVTTYGFTAALLVFMTLMSAILVAVPLGLAAMGLRTDWLIGGRWLLVFVLAAGAFTIAYRFGPSRTPARWRWLIPGGVAAAAVWLGGSAGFSWYLNHMMSLDRTYGPLGAVIGFMLWMWFSILVALMGAELSAETEHQTAVDTTVGAAKPMGRRDAAMADTVGVAFVGVHAEVGALRKRLNGLLKRLRKG